MAASQVQVVLIVTVLIGRVEQQVPSGRFTSTGRAGSHGPDRVSADHRRLGLPRSRKLGRWSRVVLCTVHVELPSAKWPLHKRPTDWAKGTQSEAPDLGRVCELVGRDDSRLRQ